MPVPVFYMPEQSSAVATGYSPSAGKPALVIADWLTIPDIACQIDVRSFEPVSQTMLSTVHSPAYVQGVLEGREKNGFGTRDLNVAKSLPYTVGSMWAAARHVMRSGGVAVSPTSGFHHAHYEYGGGFCTFNALAMTALNVKRKVLILDFDQHYGDGTEAILEMLDEGKVVTHITAGKSYDTAEEAIGVLKRLLDLTTDEEYGLVLYQAGADIHIDDPLGGRMSTKEMKQRDALVFKLAAVHRLPLVWCLAGGYQRDKKGGIEPVLALHRQTMVECLKVSGA